MNDALFLHRIHFAFTITFHYLFPQLTMGLAPLIVVLKTLALRTGNEVYNQAARFTMGARPSCCASARASASASRRARSLHSNKPFFQT